MKKFLCICLSPAIDATVRLPAWPTDGCILKDAQDVYAPGGKGLNVARWLALRGAQVACGGLLGADNATPFEKEMAKYGIEDRFVRVPGVTRVNEMFVSPQGSFKVNRPAFPGVTAGLDETAALVAAGGWDCVVMSGSLPRDYPADAYRTLVEAARKAGAETILDASGAALAEGVKAHPDVIKPNADECAPLVGFVPSSPDDFRRATEALRAFCRTPIISDGAGGCWFDGVFAAAPEVEVLDTTAAGDTLLAEWCFSRDSRRAVAAGSAACTMPSGQPPDRTLVDRLAASKGSKDQA